MRHSAHKRWKGCQLCKPHKNRTLGDSERTSFTVRRKLGMPKRRGSRNCVYAD